MRVSFEVEVDHSCALDDAASAVEAEITAMIDARLKEEADEIRCPLGVTITDAVFFDVEVG
jgi:hypothetical protein